MLQDYDNYDNVTTIMVHILDNDNDMHLDGIAKVPAMQKPSVLGKDKQERHQLLHC